MAARLEQACLPGGVLISGTVHDQLPGKLDLRFEYAGELRLKNIARPVRAYRMMLDGDSLDGGVPWSDKPAVAVLPFDNMSGDPEQAYFSDGITEDVITELSRFRDLMVIARNSSFAFRGKSTDVREIGRTLGAGYLVEGSVRRAGGRVRITVQLVDATTGTHLWAERYERALEDVFAVQEEIAQSIVATVAQRIIQDSEVAARRRQPEDVRAYDLFLQGNRLSDDFTPGGQARAQAFFEQVLQIDPGFARAHTGLAWIYLNRSVENCVGVPREQDQNRLGALRQAEEALAKDRNDPRVHSTLGYMGLMWRDFDRAEQHMDLARSLNPNDPLIQIFWAWVQSCVGRPERALLAAEIAFRLNPCHPGWYNYYRSHILFQLRRDQEAADLLNGSRWLHQNATRATWPGGQRCAVIWAASWRRSDAPRCSCSLSGITGVVTQRQVRRNTWTGLWTFHTCGGMRTRNGCARVCGGPGCQPEALVSDRVTTITAPDYG